MKSYNITLEDFLNAQKVHRGWRSLLLTLAMLIIIFLIVGDRSFFSDGKLDSTGIEILCLMSIGLLIAPFITKRMFKKAYDSHKALKETLTVEFDADTIRWEADSGNCTLKWADIYSVKQGRNLILVYETKQLMRIIPCRAFDDELELQGFLKHSSVNR